MPIAFPRAGASNVSTATSIVVYSATMPNDVTLVAGAKTFAVSRLEPLGSGIVGSEGPAQFWSVPLVDFLEPSAVHTLTASDATGAIELTHFTTAPGYDKVQGTPAKLRSLELWRERYPLSEINSGNCVFAEYHGFIRFEYDPASIPNTPPESTINFITLAPKTGGSSQVFYFSGDSGYQGQSPVGDPHAFGPWRPELDPTREYCATVTSFGDGDLARLPMVSEQVCAMVAGESNAGESKEQAAKGCACRLGSGGEKRSDFAFSVTILVSMLGALRRKVRIGTDELPKGGR
jgi:hypothetical protein